MAIKLNKNSVGNIEANKTDNTIVDSDNDYDESSLYFKDIYDFKELKKFIKHIEKKFRSSEYYSKYIGDLRNNKGLHFDANKGKLNDSFVEIEFHHYPFTLYDITYLIISDFLARKEEITSFRIISRLIYLHANNYIGLVPLSVTEHQEVHDGIKSIDINSVYGRINEFVNMYSYVMPDDLIEKYNELIKIGKNKN